MKKLIFGLLLFAIFGVAMAANGNESFGRDVRQAVMQMHAAQLECRVNFLITMLGYSEGYTGESYSEIKGSLKSSMDEVQQAADKNNFNVFIETMKKTKSYFTEGVQTIHDARVEAIQNYNGTDRQEFIQQMKDDFDSAHDEFVDCLLTATKGRISAEVSMNEYWIGEGENTAQMMRKKNYNTDKLDEILNEAAENTEEMKNINEEENDIDKLLEERKMHWEHHLWLWAQYHKERLNLLLDRIAQVTDGYDEQIEEIRGILEKAAGIGDDEYYTLGEYKEARTLIINATQRISDLVGQIQGEGASEGEEG